MVVAGLYAACPEHGYLSLIAEDQRTATCPHGHMLTEDEIQEGLAKWGGAFMTPHTFSPQPRDSRYCNICDKSQWAPHQPATAEVCTICH